MELKKCNDSKSISESDSDYCESTESSSMSDSSDLQSHFPVLLSSMGQLVGRLPESLEDLKDERSRVLHWSAEVLARVDDNVNAEDSFLIEYDNVSIANKVDKWIATERMAIPINTDLGKKFFKRSNQVKLKMQKDCENACKDLKRLNKVLDQLAEKQRKIHKQILDLEKFCPNKVHKFRRKFDCLRRRVFKNLRITEKMTFRDARLKR